MIKYNPDLEWKVGHIALSVEQEGGMKICDIRGWGFLTGTGHACGLSAEEAKKIQVKHANLIAAAPKMLEALENFPDMQDGRSSPEELREAAANWFWEFATPAMKKANSSDEGN